MSERCDFKQARQLIACDGPGVSTGGRAQSPCFFFSVRTKEPNTGASFGVNAWPVACQATDRDLESVSAVNKVNAWICALLTTYHDPASVISDKRKYVMSFFTGPVFFSKSMSRNIFSVIFGYLRNWLRL